MDEQWCEVDVGGERRPWGWDLDRAGREVEVVEGCESEHEALGQRNRWVVSGALRWDTVVDEAPTGVGGAEP